MLGRSRQLFCFLWQKILFLQETVKTVGRCWERLCWSAADGGCDDHPAATTTTAAQLGAEAEINPGILNFAPTPALPRLPWSELSYSHTHTHFLFLSLFLACTRTHTRTRSNAHSLTHFFYWAILFFSPSLSYCQALGPLSVYLSIFLLLWTHIRYLSHAHIDTHTLTLSLTLNLSSSHMLSIFLIHFFPFKTVSAIKL